MYTYKFDEETGGIVLEDNLAFFSKEPRPVYAQEMDFLGMDAHWKYDKQNDVPYLWAETNTYSYRGKVIARVKGGSLHTRPELEVAFVDGDNNGDANLKYQAVPDGESLIPMDIGKMVERNRDKLLILEQTTVKRIYNYYKKYQNKLDCFHVAFSGGKDSIVLLNLVKKALPKTSFIVMFGDTGMEFPDTYEVISNIERSCKDEGIEFYRATSHLNPLDSWKLFGPPSRVLRWCCSVHKAAPQTIMIRKIIGKPDYVGADFVGIRKYESVSRADYDYENYSKKQKGQYSLNPILDWSSAEVWLYIYTQNLVINEAYKKGNSRAGCLFCPMGGGKGDFFQYKSYPEEIDKYISLIKETNARDKDSPTALETYVANGGWNARKNGRDLTINEQHYTERIKNGLINIEITNPKSNWHEWIKTISNINIKYDVVTKKDGYTIIFSEGLFRSNQVLRRKFKQVFIKAAHCISCGVCEANCRNNSISFNGGVRIENCLHCGQCHEIDNGCLAYHSLRTPTEGTKKMNSINSFANHAPKLDWVVSYFSLGNEFWKNSGLGPNQVNMFKRFLRESWLMENNETTELFDIVNSLGNTGVNAWGLILSNLAYNSQFSWYINNLEIDRLYTRETVALKLMDAGVSSGDATSIINAFRRFSELPLGTSLHFGTVFTKGKTIASLSRNKTLHVDNRVILYSLFKFAEACEGYYQFTLSRLFAHEIISEGVSPTLIFGFDRDEMEQFLNGLTVKYPDYINATFTHDLEKISLNEEKTSSDVLKLFKV